MMQYDIQKMKIGKAFAIRGSARNLEKSDDNLGCYSFCSQTYLELNNEYDKI